MIAPPFLFSASDFGATPVPGSRDVDFLRDLGDVIKPASDKALSWQEADTRVRAAINAYDGRFRSHFEQMAAGWMLNARLFQQPRTPETLAAADYYTELLVEHRAVDAATMRRALEIVSPSWGEARVAAAATQAHADAVAFLTSKGATCLDSPCRTVQATSTPVLKFDVQDVAAVGALLDLAS